MARHIVIPVRLASTRLPRKALLDIAGKTMLEHVYHKALSCRFDSVTIATDSDEIAKVADGFGASVCMTSSEHQSGTDRIAEAVKQLGFDGEDIIVNIQGDEPLIPKENVLQAALLLEHNLDAKMSTLCEEMTTEADIFNPNMVKVVFNVAKEAMYFSRAPIPWQRGIFDQNKASLGAHYRHIGLYAYRADFLQNYAQMAKSPLEQIESLEQLRVLYHGFKIAIDIAEVSTPAGIDTLEDLEKVRAFLSE